MMTFDLTFQTESEKFKKKNIKELKTVRNFSMKFRLVGGRGTNPIWLAGSKVRVRGGAGPRYRLFNLNENVNRLSTVSWELSCFLWPCGREAEDGSIFFFGWVGERVGERGGSLLLDKNWKIWQPSDTETLNWLKRAQVTATGSTFDTSTLIAVVAVVNGEADVHLSHLGFTPMSTCFRAGAVGLTLLHLPLALNSTSFYFFLSLSLFSIVQWQQFTRFNDATKSAATGAPQWQQLDANSQR